MARARRRIAVALATALLGSAPAGAAEQASASARVPVPPAVVWSRLSDFDAWLDIFPSVAALDVHRVGERRARLRTTTRMAGRTVRYTLAAVLHPERCRIDLALDPTAPADLERLDSTWRVRRAAGGGSRIELDVTSDSGWPVPGFVERRLALRSAREAVEALVAALDGERDARAGADPRCG